MDDKLQAQYSETVTDRYEGLRPEDAECLRQYEGKAGKKVVRKIDFRLIPVMSVLYLLAHIDRGNVGNAKIEGMDTDLGLVGNQYNIISTIFFVPYIIFEIPSNAIIKKVRPSLWLTALIVCWGVVMTCMGTVQDFQQTVACRVLLGFFEAGFFPGAVFLVSSWYPRYELQQRLALFYTASAFSGAFSGLLAFAIAKMDGLRGIEGWRWIFLVEGAVTVAAGLIMPFLIPDTPEKASWLTAYEKKFIDLRLRQAGVRTNTEEGDKFSWALLGKTMIDWKILLAILMAWGNAVPNAAFKFTMPQIISQLGFSTTQSQLLTIPPYVCGGVSAWLVGRFADKFKWRMPFIVAPLIVVAVALGILLGLSSNIAGSVGPIYFAIVLAQIGIYSLLPGITAWTGNNLGTSWKRSLGLAWQLAAGNIGSIIGTNIFLDNEAPSYPTGYGVSFGIICLGLLSALALEFNLWRLNKAKSKISESEVRDKYSAFELDRMGEKSPLFKYTL
ncbi:MFS general substrate transporter [Hortaea werneckii]|nr:MFS general substrate transporter [Hortaea werneckii]